jgi:hypothetical protein
MRSLQAVLVVAVLLLAASLPAALGQGSTSPSMQPPVSAAPTDPPQRPRLPGHGQPPPDDPMRESLERQAAKKWNKERHDALKRDSDKLFQLSTELKQQVDKANENILSLDVVKKAEEIEKLAHSVREKMKANNYY